MTKVSDLPVRALLSTDNMVFASSNNTLSAQTAGNLPWSNFGAVVSHESTLVNNETILISLPLACIVPANFAGTTFDALTSSAGTIPVVVSARQSGTFAVIGTIIINTDNSLTLPTVTATTLGLPGSLKLTFPSTADVSLTNFTMAFLLTRSF